MKTDRSGNVYLWGYEEDSSLNHLGIIIKYNSLGIQQWINTYSNIGPEGKIDLDNAGNVYVISRIVIGASYDYLTIKYNSNGVFQWSAFYNGAANLDDMPHAIAFDDSLNAYITGEGTESLNGYDFVTVKYNSLISFTYFVQASVLLVS